jgi:3-hydroxybutyrate dehydrogenase
VTGPSLEGKVAVVTGANGGLGQTIVDDFRARGAEVLGVDLRGDDCFTADVGSEDGSRAIVDEALGRFGRLDILVLNAGLQHLAPVPEFALADWDRLMGVMLTGPFLSVKAAWPELIKRPGSRVLFVASTSSYTAEPFKAAYVAAKHGVLGLMKVVALEGAEHGLTANAVAPSWMRTPLVENQVAAQAEAHGLPEERVLEEVILAPQAVKRLLEPDEVADTVAYLLGPGGRAFSGAAVTMDLGWTAR